VSVDGRIYVWRIDEGPDRENKPQISGKIEVAIQIVGDAEAYHPRICWHSHKQVRSYLHRSCHQVRFACQLTNIVALYPTGNSVCWNQKLCLKNRHDKSGKGKGL
jgi:hypothetical protein